MHHSIWRWLGIIVLALVCAGLLLMQRQEAAVLQSKIAEFRARNGELTQVRAETRTLLAAEISPEELQTLRANRDALARLRGEVETLKQRANSVAQTGVTKETKVAKEQPLGPDITQEAVPAAELQNRGRKTSVAAVETALWAAVGGDIDTLAETLFFEPNVRSKAEALMNEIPVEERKAHGTPERFIAAMTVKDVPLGTLRVFKPSVEFPHMIAAQLTYPTEGKIQTIGLALREGVDGWRLIVPSGAVEKYAAMLKAEKAGRELK